MEQDQNPENEETPKDPAESEQDGFGPPEGKVTSGTLLDAALYNLDVARQYIDESKYLEEHRLISFHYGVALMASPDDRKNKRNLAAQCFLDALNWQPRADANEEQIRAFRRIVCEANYNLGVIREYQTEYDHAARHFEEAETIADKYEFRGAGILSRFGWISVKKKKLQSLDTEGRDELRRKADSLRETLENAGGAPVPKPRKHLRFPLRTDRKKTPEVSTRPALPTEMALPPQPVTSAPDQQSDPLLLKIRETLHKWRSELGQVEDHLEEPGMPPADDAPLSGS